MDDELDKALAKIRAQQASSPQHDDMDAALAKIRAGQPAPTPEGPGAISRGFSAAGRGLANVVMHPIDTAESIATAIPKTVGDVFNATVSPGVGEARHDARLSKGGNSSGRAIDTSPFDAEHGGITAKERTQAGARGAATLAAAPIFGGAKAATALIPKVGAKIATTTGLAASGAATGAASNLDDPLAGAVAGGIAAPVLGGAVNTLARPNLLTTGIRAKFAADPTVRLPKLAAARDAVAAPLYDDFRSLGDLGRTPQLDALIGTATADGLPVVRRAVEAVKGESPVLAKLPDTDARVLAAVYERVGDKAFRTLHGFQTDEARRALLSAIDDAAQAKGGSFAEPVQAFREGSREIKAVSRGKDALENALSAKGGSEGAAITKSPTALQQWAQRPTTSADELQRATQGVLGQVGRRGVLASVRLPGTPHIPLPLPSRALLKGTSILQSLKPPQSTDQIMQLMGIPAATITNNP